MPLRYRAVLFDLDGTLIDSYAALAEAVNHACRQHGRPELNSSRIRDLVGEGVERLLERVFAPSPVPIGALETFEQRYDEICCRGSRVLDDVHETLMKLDGLGTAMAVCTNKPTSFSTKILQHLDLAAFFSAIVGPDAAGARKPEAQHVLYALAATGCRAEEGLFVGDMPIDIRAARNSGMDVAVIATGSASETDLRASQPDYVLGRFSDLLGVVAA